MPEPAPVVRRADRMDLDAMAAVLGQAFADYPATRWTVDARAAARMPLAAMAGVPGQRSAASPPPRGTVAARDHPRRVTGLQRLSLEHLGLPFGQAWVAEVDGAVASVAVWMDSRVPVPST